MSLLAGILIVGLAGFFGYRLMDEVADALTERKYGFREPEKGPVGKFLVRIRDFFVRTGKKALRPDPGMVFPDDLSYNDPENRRMPEEGRPVQEEICRDTHTGPGGSAPDRSALRLKKES